MDTSSRPRTSARTRADTLRFTDGPCSLGAFLVARSAHGLCALLLGDSVQQLRSDLRVQFPAARLERDAEGLRGLATRVAAIIEDPATAAGFDEPLDLGGTPFQRRVWRALRGVAPGQTACYARIARRIGKPDAARAVAAACAANPVAILVPCHRVARKDGRAAGYRWGAARRDRLLQREVAAGAPEPVVRTK